MGAIEIPAMIIIIIIIIIIMNLLNLAHDAAFDSNRWVRVVIAIQLYSSSFLNLQFEK